LHVTKKHIHLKQKIANKKTGKSANESFDRFHNSAQHPTGDIKERISRPLTGWSVVGFQ